MLVSRRICQGCHPIDVLELFDEKISSLKHLKFILFLQRILLQLQIRTEKVILENCYCAIRSVLPISERNNPSTLH